MKTTKVERDDFLFDAIDFFEKHTQYWKVSVVKAICSDIDTLTAECERLRAENEKMREALQNVWLDDWSRDSGADTASEYADECLAELNPSGNIQPEKESK